MTAVATDSDVTPVALVCRAVTAIIGSHWCHSAVFICITVKVHAVASDTAVTALTVAIAVTLMCTSLPQHCHFHCCLIAVLVFAITALCTSVSNRCGIPPVYSNSSTLSVTQVAAVCMLFLLHKWHQLLQQMASTVYERESGVDHG